MIKPNYSNFLEADLKKKVCVAIKNFTTCTLDEYDEGDDTL